ncbi:hypothetical protein BT96DRAFT_921092 [Gymnopus androsaceus JB14]|uniref:VWFA domain-containing protein n=1 Tax=Gymnopus androsaceus JB14 TaxID=1447944 RepID=A0A6A4HMC8_9AGAR|nr:hypothetical protein BT96DRAFT_921092 [Gymnopus androsaceus JB14]
MPPPNNEQLLDLVFVLDCTGSMRPYIRGAESSINEIVKAILNAPQLTSPSSLRVGVQAYRDAIIGFVEFLTKPCPLTSNVAVVHDFLKNLNAAGGGGDGPEAVATALDRTLNDKNELGWQPAQKGAHKIIVHITDAPPHGIKEIKDNFPNGGEPDTRGMFTENILNVNKIMKAHNINYFVVSCGEMGKEYRFAVPFYRRATRGTGYMLPLVRYDLLPKAITALALESLDLDVALEEMKKELGDFKKKGGPYTTSYISDVAPMHRLFMTIVTPEAANEPLTDDELQVIMDNAVTPEDLETLSKAARPKPADAVKTIHGYFKKKGTKIRTMKTNVDYHYTGAALHNWNIMENAKTPADLVGGVAVPEGIPLSSDAEQSVEIVEEPITEEQIERMAIRYKAKYGHQSD